MKKKKGKKLHFPCNISRITIVFRTIRFKFTRGPRSNLRCVQILADRRRRRRPAPWACVRTPNQSDVERVRKTPRRRRSPTRHSPTGPRDNVVALWSPGRLWSGRRVSVAEVVNDKTRHRARNYIQLLTLIIIIVATTSGSARWSYQISLSWRVFVCRVRRMTEDRTSSSWATTSSSSHYPLHLLLSSLGRSSLAGGLVGGNLSVLTRRPCLPVTITRRGAGRVGRFNVVRKTRRHHSRKRETPECVPRKKKCNFFPCPEKEKDVFFSISQERIITSQFYCVLYALRRSSFSITQKYQNAPLKGELNYCSRKTFFCYFLF